MAAGKGFSMRLRLLFQERVRWFPFLTTAICSRCGALGELRNLRIPEEDFAPPSSFCKKHPSRASRSSVTHSPPSPHPVFLPFTKLRVPFRSPSVALISDGSSHTVKTFTPLCWSKEQNPPFFMNSPNLLKKKSVAVRVSLEYSSPVLFLVSPNPFFCQIPIIPLSPPTSDILGYFVSLLFSSPDPRNHPLFLMLTVLFPLRTSLRDEEAMSES